MSSACIYIRKYCWGVHGLAPATLLCDSYLILLGHTLCLGVAEREEYTSMDTFQWNTGFVPNGYVVDLDPMCDPFVSLELIMRGVLFCHLRWCVKDIIGDSPPHLWRPSSLNSVKIKSKYMLAFLATLRIAIIFPI